MNKLNEYKNQLNLIMIELNKLDETKEVETAKQLLMVNFVFLTEIGLIEDENKRNESISIIENKITKIIVDFQDFIKEKTSN